MATTKTDNQRWQLLKKAFAIAKHEHGMEPDVFRETVPRWGFPRLSSCSAADLRAIINKMKRWFTAHPDGKFCTQHQLDYLQTLWEQKSDAKTKESLKSYLINNFGETEPRLMSKDTASLAIQSLKRWNNNKE